MTAPVRHLFIPGKAVAQGSKRAIVNKGGSVSVIESNRDGLATYRADIREQWHRNVGTGWEGRGAIAILIVVYKERPKSQRTSKGALAKGAPLRPTSRPDLDKIARSVLDALTGHAFSDDAQVVDLHAIKAFSEGAPVGTAITIWDLEGDILTPTVPTP